MLSKTINGKAYLFVEVPETAIKFYIPTLNELKYTTKPPHKMDWETIDIKLEYGKYNIIGKASELKEDQWKEIVEMHRDAYYDYEVNSNYIMTARGSGLTLIASLNLKPKTTLIIEKLC
jgi:hypothetical protein